MLHLKQKKYYLCNYKKIREIQNILVWQKTM